MYPKNHLNPRQKVGIEISKIMKKILILIA